MTEAPDFTLRFEQRANYLYAFMSGPTDNLDVSTRCWKQIHAKAVEFGSKRLLVEEDFPNQGTTMEMFKVAEFVSELFRDETRIAHVDRRAADMDLNRFGETVGINRGLSVRVFDNLRAAEKWLSD
jgi:hypothetical protein